MDEKKNLKPIIESLLFVHEKPLTIEKIEEIIPGSERDEIINTLSLLMEDYNTTEHKGLQLVEVANGFQICTKKQYEHYIKKLYTDAKTKKFSKPSLEILSIIAYKQPITRSEIEALRGVEGGGILRHLLETRLIKIAGRKNVPGKPILYSTTEDFLIHFGLKSLEELPPLQEMNQLLEQK